MPANRNDVTDLFQQAVENHLQENLNRALELYQMVLDRNPAHAEAFHNIGLIFMTMGDNRKAVEFFHSALSLNHAYPDALNNLGTALKKEKDFQGAGKAFEKALELKPDFIQARFNLGNLYREVGDCDKAIDAFYKVVALAPNDHDAFNNLGAALSAMGRSNEAKQALLGSLAIKPDQPSANYNLGTILLKEDNLAPAEEAFRKAIQTEPAFSDAYLNLGNVMKVRGELQEAVRFFEKAVEMDPMSADGYYNLGLAFEIEKDLDREVHTQRKALKLCPDNIQSWIGGVRTFSKIADWKSIDPLIGKIAQYDFSKSQNALLSSALFMFHAHPMTDKALFEKHIQWGDHFSQSMKRNYSDAYFDFTGHKPDDEKLRIGYVSPDFCRHSVGWFFRQIALHHDPDHFQIFCYATDKRADDLTQDIENTVACFKNVDRWQTLRLAREIYQDRIHILVDLAGHTMKNRLDVFALRPSPVQVTMLGYPNGTGLRTVDYRVTDRYAETDSSKSACLEKHVLLRHGFLPFYPIQYSKKRPTREALGLPKKGVLVVSFNRAGKLRAEVLSLWNRLLTRCPNAILALVCGHTGRRDLRENVLSFFAANSNRDRVCFIERAETEELHRARYLIADIALDSFPYAGTTTSYEALGMNVPVVTLAGSRHVQRTTFSILKHLGIEDTIAHSEEEYVEKAAALIQDPVLLRRTKEKLSRAFKSAVATQPRAYTEELERAFRLMWNRYSQGEPPADMAL